MKDKIINIGTTVVVKIKLVAYENGFEYELRLKIKGIVTGFISCISGDTYYVVKLTDGMECRVKEEDIVDVLSTQSIYYTIEFEEEENE